MRPPAEAQLSQSSQEIERLREALEAIAKGQWNTTRYRKDGSKMRSVGEFARAAPALMEGV